MNNISRPVRKCLFAASQCAVFLALVFLVAPLCVAQKPELQQRVAEVKQAAAKNKQSLAQYTWTEQQTISIKGEVKKQSASQVRLGPDGKPQKTPLNAEPASSGGGGRKRGLKAKVVAKKKEEFQDYAERMVSLIHLYAPPDPQRLQNAYQQGNISMGPTGGPGEFRLVIQNYYKPKDSLTLVFHQQQMAIVSVQVASYLDDPGDAVTLSVEFDRLPDGTSHASTTTMNGVSKKLTVTMQNSNYQKM